MLETLFSYHFSRHSDGNDGIRTISCWWIECEECKHMMVIEVGIFLWNVADVDVDVCLCCSSAVCNE